jgi:putative transposase
MLAEGECYHVFNRGAHKQAIFHSTEDYDRFQILLYLLNTKLPIVMREILDDYKGRSLGNIYLEEPSDRSLVDVLGYALMPNHFHLILRQKADAGISRFLKKLCTAYSMYFNAKYEHSGVLFQGRYKANHIDNEAYFRYIFSYVHLNPLELVQPTWKESGIKNRALAKSWVSNYQHSSFRDYVGNERPESFILANHDIPDFLKEQNDLDDLLQDAKDRPLELSTVFPKDQPL